MKRSRFLIVFVSIFLMAASGSRSEDLYHNQRNDLIQLRDSLRSAVNLHSNWTGPPCYKDRSRWFGIKCSNSNVVGITLEGIQLTGSLRPDALQNVTYLANLSLRRNAIHGSLPNLKGLVHLRIVSLSRNRFSGPIPKEFASLPSLTQLELQDNLLNGTIPPFNQHTLTEFNVSYNFLQGRIPETSILQNFPKSSFDHNMDLCGKSLNKPCSLNPPGRKAPPHGLMNPPGDKAPLNGPTNGAPPPSRHFSQPKTKGLELWSILLIALGAVLVLFMVILLSLCYNRRYQKAQWHRDHSEISAEFIEKAAKGMATSAETERRIDLEFFNKEKVAFDLDTLLRSSADIMGKGKLGITYKVTLESGLITVVKKLKNMNGVSRKEFVQHLQLLGRLRHEYIVEIISYYYSKEEKLVIYDHIPGGSLFQLLHDHRGEGRMPLKWAARLSIVKGIARGLAYLHQCLPFHTVPHANLKSSNVLILHMKHQNYSTKLTDYGFQPLLPHMHKLAVEKTPEFSQGRRLTNKADVFCFGLILLEVVTGKFPSKDDEDLSQWVRSAVRDEWSTDILDLEIVAEKEGHGDMLRLTEIALECTAFEPERRPKMSEVIKKIEEINDTASERKTLIIDL
ncbi:probable leucine-rich repeat receptor-like protein kinase At1g68400 [Typha latifolia]|uniref:probable leucine-rich repeat receptor-like protein kinase At1g68400 n=1 Tax=Typha latifolia TaxID=4733 RepID=UPI003C2BBE76